MSVEIASVCLPAPDLEAAVRFYAYVLRKDGRRIAEGLHQFALGKVTLTLRDSAAFGVTNPPPHGAPLVLAVDEPLELALQRLGALEARHVDAELRTLPTGDTGFYLRDPCGNRIAVISAHAALQPAPRPASSEDLPMLTLHKDFLNVVKGGNLSKAREMLLLDAELATLRDGSGVSAIMHAAYKHQPHVALFLADRAGAIDFWEACALGQAERAAASLDADPGLVNRPSPDGFLPLGLACYFGHYPTVDLLLNRGAEVNAMTDNPRQLRPLHSATGHRDAVVARKIVQRLLMAGADVHAVQQGGYTALHQAADRGDLELVNLLLNAGAVPSVAADNGRTPMSLAIAWNHDAIVGRLTAAGRAA